jgi:hypothetical protein
MMDSRLFEKCVECDRPIRNIGDYIRRTDPMGGTEEFFHQACYLTKARFAKLEARLAKLEAECTG